MYLILDALLVIFDTNNYNELKGELNDKLSRFGEDCDSKIELFDTTGFDEYSPLSANRICIQFTSSLSF